MPRIEHPRYEELLLLESGELDDDRQEVVARHVSSCPECGALCAQATSIRAVVAASAQPLTEDEVVPRPLSRYLRPAAALATAAALAAYLLTDATPAARADELLELAAVRQAQESRDVRRLLLQGDAAACYVTNAGLFEGPVGGDDPRFCDSLATVFGASGWVGSELLSARRFQAWRSSLSRKTDAIVETEEMSGVETSTTEGALRSAALYVRASDRLPIAAHYEFEVGASVHVTEAPMELADSPDTETPEDTTAQDTAPEPVAVDPRPRLEARVRLVLHQLRADRNIQIDVQARGQSIRVWGVVADDRARADIVRGLAGVEGAKVSLVTEREMYESDGEIAAPWIAFQGDAPPLAHDELDALFLNDPQGRQTLLNELDAETRRLLAAAKSRDALRRLAARLSAGDQAPALTSAAADFDPIVQAGIENIAGMLEPVIGPVEGGAGQSLTYAQAVELYNLVHQVAFLSVAQERAALPEALDRVRQLLK